MNHILFITYMFYGVLVQTAIIVTNKNLTYQQNIV